MKCNKILVALSGGVDSSVCVYLMKQQGYDVTGLVLRLSPAHNSTVAAAQAAADAMGIPLIVAREEEWFQREVVVPWLNVTAGDRRLTPVSFATRPPNSPFSAGKQKTGDLMPLSPAITQVWKNRKAAIC